MRPKSLMGSMIQQMQADIDEMSDLMGMPSMSRRFGMIDPFGAFERAPLLTQRETRMGARMQVDLSETDAGYELSCDLPGVPKDKVSVKMTKDNILEISA